MSAINRYVADVLSRGELYIELERVRNMLVRMHEHPVPNRENQRELVSHATKLFQGLLAAKAARLIQAQG